MKVDGLSKYYRILVMLDWFEDVLGLEAPELCVKIYYDSNLKELKDSIRGLYNRYWEILKNTFGIEPYHIDFDAHTGEDYTALVDGIKNHIVVIGTDRDTFLDNVDSASCIWDQFLREMTMTLINIRANGFIAKASSEFLQEGRELNFDDIVSFAEVYFDRFVASFIYEESLYERLCALISMLSSVRTAYLRYEGYIFALINVPEGEKEESEVSPDTIEELQKAFDNLKDFEYYRSLFIELRDLCNENANPDPMKLLEKYYSILDEIYFDVYSLGTLVPSLVVKYNESHGGNTK